MKLTDCPTAPAVISARRLWSPLLRRFTDDADGRSTLSQALRPRSALIGFHVERSSSPVTAFVISVRVMYAVVGARIAPLFAGDLLADLEISAAHSPSQLKSSPGGVSEKISGEKISVPVNGATQRSLASGASKSEQ